MSATVRVYRFMYFNWTTRQMVNSGDFATAHAIQEMGGQALTTYLDVDPSRVSGNGLYLAADSKSLSVVQGR